MERASPARVYYWTPYLLRLAELVPSPLLDSVGLIVIADLPQIQRSSALNGKPSLHEFATFTPGMYRQNDARKLNDGEYPACAAMTTGYVFRVENEALVYYMQRVGKPGQLTTLTVKKSEEAKRSRGSRLATECQRLILYVSLLTVALLSSMDDWTAITAWWIYFAVRYINNIVIHRRESKGWKGKKEPGVESDLLVLLSNDRWIRLRGLTDDVKLITSGAWLRDPTWLEELGLTFATILIFLNVGIISSCTREGKMLLLIQILLSTFLMEIANANRDQLNLFDRTVSFEKRKAYERRLDMAEELVDEIGRDDWCEKMGIILSRERSSGKNAGPAVM